MLGVILLSLFTLVLGFTVGFTASKGRVPRLYCRRPFIR